jgi:hypothetical protein
MASGDVVFEVTNLPVTSEQITQPLNNTSPTETVMLGNGSGSNKGTVNVPASTANLTDGVAFHLSRPNGTPSFTTQPLLDPAKKYKITVTEV